MELLNTEHKRKSAILTTIIMGMLLFMIFFFGLKYLDPPEEYGIAVNFGTSDVGSGDTESEPAPASSSPQEQVEEVEQEQVEEVVEEVQEVQETPTEPVSTPTKAEDVITNDNAESIKINKEKEARRKAEETQKRIKEAEQRAEREAKLKAERIRKQKAAAKAAKEAKEAKEKADKRKGVDNLLGGLNKGDSKGSGTGGTGTSGGEGNDNGSGNKGSLDGDPYSNSYYGSGGGSGGGGYGLNGRSLTKSGQGFKQDCNEYGKVVVRIEVDKNGRVIKATPGVKGSTNTDPCLLAPARKSAMSFRWNADAKAPTKQTGFVIVSFN